MGFEQLPPKQAESELSYFNWRPPTQVRVDLSFTRNLGNFESIKIGIGVDDYVRDGESVESATDRVYKFVESKLISKTQEVEEELNGNK